MFNIGFTELLILSVIGLLVIGPEQLPELARKVAKVLNELKRAKDEIMSPVNEFKNEAHRAVAKMRKEMDGELIAQASELMKKDVIENIAVAAENDEHEKPHKN